MKVVIIALLTVFCFSCKKNSNNPNSPKTRTVYVAGGGNILNKSVPVYWKDGKEIILQSDANIYIGGIYVSGDDIYLCGYISTKQDYSKACYWKNEKRIDLTDGKGYANATGITVVGNDVYVAGYVDDTAKYWKNGAPVILSGGIEATSIAVSKNVVYITGIDHYGSSSNAIYWKNGNVISLSATSGTSSAHKIFLDGNDVYIAGTDNFKAVYWKNGSEIILGDGEAYSIAVFNNNVYLAGYNYLNTTSKYIAKYWKNGVDIPIVDSGSARSLAYDIAINGDDVYIAGVDIGPALDFTQNHPKLWKNGVEESLPQTYNNEYASCILIK